MKLRIVRIGKRAFSQYQTLCEEYQKRLRTHFSLEMIELKAKPEFSKDKHLLLEACLPEKIRKQFRLIVLDDEGDTFTSELFAKTIQRANDDPSISGLCFIIGHPFGFPEEFVKFANTTISLSKLTFTSDLAELVLWEQLYRAHSINTGSSYHHE